MTNQRNLLKGDIRKLFLQYLIPSVGGMLGISLYVLGDTMIVGWGLGNRDFPPYWPYYFEFPLYK